VLVEPPRRLQTSKPQAPPPPQKFRKVDSFDVEEENTAPTFAASMPKKEYGNEPQGLAFRKLGADIDMEQDCDNEVPRKAVEDQKLRPFAHNGETLLATFYGMLYTNDCTEKEWKLEIDGFIPICFVQVHGNPNKPFKIIAVENSRRIMEYLVLGSTTCARNSTFVWWQDGSSMFGLRFGKENQAEQFLSTVKRMASTLAKASELMKQEHDRKAVIKQISDPTSSSSIHHTKVSLMIKLPDKQTTVMSVPGLLTMSELFEMVCEKENLDTTKHQLSLPRTGGRKVTFDSGTAVGSLRIREIAIIRTTLSDSRRGSSELDVLEDLLDLDGEESKILQIVLPTGIQKSYKVSIDMTLKQLVMRICSRERLNPRHHSLQYIDFKHEFLSMSGTVSELDVNEIRLMDKREFRRSSGVDSESDSSSTISGEEKENALVWQRSKSLDALVDGGGDVFAGQDQLATANEADATAPISLPRNAGGGPVKKKPAVFPKPNVVKSSTLPKKPPPFEMRSGVRLKNQSFSPIKKDSIYASTPDLSFSSKSELSPGTNDIKTSTPENKIKRRTAPPPPPRPAVPKALFGESKTDSKPVVLGPPSKKSNCAIRSKSSHGQSSIPAATSGGQLKPSQKKRPAPERPARPAPPKPVRQCSTDSKDSLESIDSTDRTKEIKASFKRRSVSLDLGLPHGYLEDDENGKVDWRGVPPIFIPPPPPSELPPPLDECDTPVEPLTEFEAGFLEGNGPTNGVVEFEKYLVPSPRQSVIKGELSIEPSDRMSVLATVHEHASFPVVPPPPLYSEPSSECSSNEILPPREPVTLSIRDEVEMVVKPTVHDVPPLFLETESIITTQDNEEKDRDSECDQSSEGVSKSLQAGLTQTCGSGSWDDNDSGSSVDGVSAIPPPFDFASTRPITPPCQFANPTVDPPEEVTKVHEADKTILCRAEYIPWMGEDQVPLNAKGRGTNRELEMISSKDIIKLDHNIEETSPDENSQKKTDEILGTNVVIGTCTGDQQYENQDIEKRSVQVANFESYRELEKQAVEVNVAAANDTSSGIGLSTDLSRKKKERPVTVQSHDLRADANTLNEVVNGKVNSKTEQQIQISKRVKPEPKGKPHNIVKQNSGVHVSTNPESLQMKKLREQRGPLNQQRQFEVEKFDQNLEPEKTEIKDKLMEVFEGSFTENAQSNWVARENEIVNTENSKSVSDALTLERKFEREVPPAMFGGTSTQSFIPEWVIPTKPLPVSKVKQPDTKSVPGTKVLVNSKLGVQQCALSRLHSSTVSNGGEQEDTPAKPDNRESCDDMKQMTTQFTEGGRTSLDVLNYKNSETSQDKCEQKYENKDTNVAADDVEGGSVFMEALVTSQTKPTNSPHDRLRELEGMLQELDKEASSSTSYPPHASERQGRYEELPTKSKLVEKVVVFEPRQEEERLELNSEGEWTMDVTLLKRQEDGSVFVEQMEDSDAERSQMRTGIDSELRLDLSSVQEAHVLPRPPSSSPPTTTPRSFTLHSPSELYSDRSTESGISLSEESKISFDSSGPVRDKENVAVQTCSTQTELQSDGDVVSENIEATETCRSVKPMNESSGVPAVSFSNDTITLTDSNLSDSTSGSSPPCLSSPVETINTVELPRPPPLRHHPDLASDLGLISSAAKVTEKEHESETKPEASSKRGESLLGQSTVSVVERPRSWVGPEVNNKRSIMWTSAFKPISFVEQGKKVAHPVSFQVKPFTGTSSVDPSIQPIVGSTEVTVTGSSLDESSKDISLDEENIQEKANSPAFKESHQTVSTDANNNPILKKPESFNSKGENLYFSSNFFESQRAPKDCQIKSVKAGPECTPSTDSSSSAASIRDQIMRDSMVGHRAQRSRPFSAIVDSSKFQVLTAGPKSSIETGGSWADVKKRAAYQVARMGKTENSSHEHASVQEDKLIKPDLRDPAAKPPRTILAENSRQKELQRIDNNKDLVNAHDKSLAQVKVVDAQATPEQPTKTGSNSFPLAFNKSFSSTENVKQGKAVDSALPTVIMRTKTGKEDPSKRHSMPAYIIPGTDRQPSKTSVSGGQVRVEFP